MEKNNIYYMQKLNDKCQYNLNDLDGCKQISFYEKNKIKISKGKMNNLRINPVTYAKNKTLTISAHSCMVHLIIYLKPNTLDYIIDESVFNEKTNTKTSERENPKLIQKWREEIKIN
jgi:hypothetical protein